MSLPIDDEKHVALVIADIRTAGCHVLHVAEEASLPPYSYSIGLNRSLGAPDLVVVGLARDLAHSVIYRYRDEQAAGRRFPHRARARGLLPDADVEFRDVHSSHFATWFGWNVALYAGTPFRMQQFVYPASDGTWPWEPQAPEWFRKRQPLFDAPATGGRAPLH